jgi:hypothetical protein
VISDTYKPQFNRVFYAGGDMERGDDFKDIVNLEIIDMDTSFFLSSKLNDQIFVTVDRENEKLIIREKVDVGKPRIVLEAKVTFRKLERVK